MSPVRIYRGPLPAYQYAQLRHQRRQGPVEPRIADAEGMGPGRLVLRKKGPCLEHVYGFRDWLRLYVSMYPRQDANR
jgi:hypothetical protein